MPTAPGVPVRSSWMRAYRNNDNFTARYSVNRQAQSWYPRSRVAVPRRTEPPDAQNATIYDVAAPMVLILVL